MRKLNSSFGKTLFLTISLIFSINIIAQKKYSKSKLKKHKLEVNSIVSDNHKQTQIMIDKIFSFAELVRRYNVYKTEGQKRFCDLGC